MKIRRRFPFLVLITVLTISCDPPAQESKQIDKEQIEKEVWSTIETRFFAWRDNDYETFAQTQHPDWKRWSTDSNSLIDNEEYKNIWQDAKGSETVLEMELQLEKITISPLGDAAIAHFTSKEKFEWIGTESNSGREQGDIYDNAILRWSEILVLEDGKWLSIGGHRDLSRPEKRPIKIN